MAAIPPRERLGEAEVEELDLPLRGHLDVRRLQVAVEDPLGVRGVERVCDVPRDDESAGDGDRAFCEELLDRLARNELHDEKADAVRPLEAVDAGDIRVVEGGEELGLALEAGRALDVVHEFLGKDLDGDLAAEARVARPPDLAHAAGSEKVDDLVRTEAGPGNDRHGGYRPLSPHGCAPLGRAD